MSTWRGFTGLGVAGVLMSAVAACSGDGYPIEVTGDTGQCEEFDTVWSGEPVGGVVPGSTLERTVRCSGGTMSDERLTGESEITFRCDFTAEGDTAVGDCTQASTVTNDGGMWQDDDGVMTIVVKPAEPARIVEDGVRIGTGDYEGLRFAYHVESVPEGYPWPITGTLERAD